MFEKNQNLLIVLNFYLKKQNRFSFIIFVRNQIKGVIHKLLDTVRERPTYEIFLHHVIVFCDAY
ncbi:MAG TPA: hypothetical protein DCO90_21335 [Sphingobacterium sp.]|nr:hypothetical protein [Sphingobacterium sp.]